MSDDMLHSRLCDAAGPLSLDEFSQTMSGLGILPPVAVGVSGGGDSMALLHLTKAWADTRPAGGWPAIPGLAARAPVTALTVDHGLRPEAGDEAAWVEAQARQLGVPHETLRVPDAVPPKSNLQDWARRLRYRLFETWCRDHGVPAVLTGHTQDDQAETLVMRLGRGSGVDGLSGIPIRRDLVGPDGQPSATVLRPLLKTSRDALRRYLEGVGQPWLDDPSNRDERFTRARLRRVLDLLAREGIGVAGLADTADRLTEARLVLEDVEGQARADAVTYDRSGFAVLDLDRVRRLPREIALRLVRHVARAIGGSAYPPRADRLSRLLDALQAPDENLRGRTLGGCRFLPEDAAGGRMLAVRESRHLEGPLVLEAGAVRVWDGRFRVSLPARGQGGVVMSLGQGGRATLRMVHRFSGDFLPRPVLAGLPALWRNGAPVAVPGLGYDPGATGFQAIFPPATGAAPLSRA